MARRRSGIFGSYGGRHTSPTYVIPPDEGGGGGAPAWVPANAKIHIDFVTPQGRAWVQGTGEVAVDTLVGGDLNTENAWGTSGYSSDDLTADGLVHGSTFPALIGAARSLVLDEATVVVRYKQVVGTALTNSPAFTLVSEDGNDALEFDLLTTSLNSHHEATASTWNGPMYVETTNWANIANGAVNVIAVTITATRAEIALDGGTAVAGMMDEIARPPGNPLVAAFIDCGGDGQIALQSITLYDPLPDTTGLSELSQVA